MGVRVWGVRRRKSCMLDWLDGDVLSGLELSWRWWVVGDKGHRSRLVVARVSIHYFVARELSAHIILVFDDSCVTCLMEREI